MLVYDGDCGFCTASARWIARRLPAGTPVVAAADADLEGLGLSDHDVATAAWWIDLDEGRHRGHRAIARALVAAGGLWGLVGRVLLVPPVSWLAAAVYALVARHRHRLPGGDGSCPVPR